MRSFYNLFLVGSYELPFQNTSSLFTHIRPRLMLATLLAFSSTSYAPEYSKASYELLSSRKQIADHFQPGLTMTRV